MSKMATNQLPMSKVLMKVTFQVKDPLRKSVPDKTEAELIRKRENMSENALTVSKKIVDDASVEAYRKPLKELQKFYYDNTLPVGKGKQPHRVVPIKSLNKFQKDFMELLTALDDGIIVFNRAYSNREQWLAHQRERMGGKFIETDYPSVDEVKKGLKVTHSIDAFGDVKSASGTWLNAETIALLEKQQTEQEKVIETYASSMLWESIMEPLRNMSEKLAIGQGENGAIFRDTLVSNLKDIADRIPSLNFQGDTRLEEIRKDITSMLQDVDPDDLRKDPEKREETKVQANRVLEKMGGYGKRQPA